MQKIPVCRHSSLSELGTSQVTAKEKSKESCELFSGMLLGQEGQKKRQNIAVIPTHVFLQAEETPALRDNRMKGLQDQALLEITFELRHKYRNMWKTGERMVTFVPE